MSTDFQLQDIPDLTGFDFDGPRSTFEPFVDGWYKGTILAKREFTDKNGNDRVFESSDTPAQKSGRNIRLQVELTRSSDGSKLNISHLINYKPEYLTPETVQAVAARGAAQKESGAEWGDLFAPYMTLVRLQQLQKIASIRKFQSDGNGGLDISPLYGKTAYFRIKNDPNNPAYKTIASFQIEAPKRVPVN